MAFCFQEMRRKVESMMQLLSERKNKLKVTETAIEKKGQVVNKVEKIQIGYAKLAKKVDMKKLKSVEWTILQENSFLDVSNKENDTNEANVSGEANPNGEWRADTRFSEMYGTLKKQGKLPSKMVDSLSVPLAFVALLHLCNEQTLALKDEPDFSDLTICKG